MEIAKSSSLLATASRSHRGRRAMCSSLVQNAYGPPRANDPHLYQKRLGSPARSSRCTLLFRRISCADTCLQAVCFAKKTGEQRNLAATASPKESASMRLCTKPAYAGKLRLPFRRRQKVSDNAIPHQLPCLIECFTALHAKQQTVQAQASMQEARRLAREYQRYVEESQRLVSFLSLIAIIALTCHPAGRASSYYYTRSISG